MEAIYFGELKTVHGTNPDFSGLFLCRIEAKWWLVDASMTFIVHIDIPIEQFYCFFNGINPINTIVGYVFITFAMVNRFSC